MKYIEYKERVTHGTFDFPIQYYYVDSHHPRYEMQTHWHSEFELIYIRKGLLRMDLDGETFDAVEGDVIFVMGGVCHSGIPCDCEYECLVFNLDYFVRQNSVGNQKINNILSHRHIVLCKLPSQVDGLGVVVKRLMNVMRGAQDGYELLVHGLMCELLGIIVCNHLYSDVAMQPQRSQNQQTSLKNAIQYIEENYARHISLEDLAQAAGMNRKYFCSFFRNMTFKTPFEYLNAYRVGVAGTQLLSTEKTITEIACFCGFNDASYFAKVFRKHMGETPLAYRKKYKRPTEE